jgi:exodeoxyribonuclease VII small subunit
MKDVQEIEALSFEESYTRLEQIIQKLESGDLSLDESMSLYEEGVRLAHHCEHQLDDAQIKVTQLLSAAHEQVGENPAAGG